MKKLFLVFLGLTMLLIPASAGALSIGVWGDWATIGQQFNDSIAGYIGASYFGSNPSETDYLVKADLNLVKLGDVQTKMGLYYTGCSLNNTALGLTWGVSAMVKPNLSVGGDITLVDSRTTNGGTAITDILPTARLAVNLYF